MPAGKSAEKNPNKPGGGGTAEITQEGRHVRLKYRGVDILTTFTMPDARAWAGTFEDAVNQHGKGEDLRVWLGGNSAVVASSRDALVSEVGPGGVSSRNEKVQSAIEHTDPAWRHLGIDETAGDPDLREFDKTDAGFVRLDAAVKAPGLPADPNPVGAAEVLSRTELEKVMKDRGVPEPGDVKTALDPRPEEPDNA